MLSWERLPLDAEAMHRAAQPLLGEHDFNAFRSVQCQAAHARRDLQAICVRRDGEQLTVEVQANAFLHHMVRNLVGSLLMVGRGERPESWIAELLAGQDRTVAGPTAPAEGLVFEGPLYPARWGFAGCGDDWSGELGNVVAGNREWGTGKARAQLSPPPLEKGGVEGFAPAFAQDQDQDQDQNQNQKQIPR